MNTGISLAKGEWLYFLGSGDYLVNNVILSQVFLSTNTSKYSLLSGKIVYEGDTNPFIYSKNKRIKTPSWSFALWLRNGLHHQGTFYKRTLFTNQQYNLKFKILSDYWFHIVLYKQQKACKILPFIIAKCNSDGVSKSGSWQLYKEEIHLKILESSIFLAPIFYGLAFAKYILRKFNEL